jgi:hypothetical protein
MIDVTITCWAGQTWGSAGGNSLAASQARMGAAKRLRSLEQRLWSSGAQRGPWAAGAEGSSEV